MNTQIQEFLNILTDIRTGALPLREAPSFLLWFFKKIIWLCIVCALLLSTLAPLRAEARPHTHLDTINTGIENGTVNARQCPSTTCTVLFILTEGGQIITAETPGSDWLLALTPQHGQGWIYSRYVQR